MICQYQQLEYEMCLHHRREGFHGICRNPRTGRVLRHSSSPGDGLSRFPLRPRIGRGHYSVQDGRDFIAL